MDDYWRVVNEEEQGLLHWEAEAPEGNQGQRPMDLEMATTGKEFRGMDFVVSEEERPMDDYWRLVNEEERGLHREAEATERNQEQRPMDLATATTGSCVWDFIKRNPIGVTINPASLSPPPLAGGAPSSSLGGWVLLDLKAYIAGCTNATTAKDFTRAGHEIQATLRVARPPSVSQLCVYCPGLNAANFGTEPLILAASDGIIFFRAAICNSNRCDEPSMQEYFIYRAPISRVHGVPSLTRLQHPDLSSDFARCHVGLMRCDEGGDDDDGDDLTLRPHCIPRQHYIIAGLRVSQGRSDLHRFDSREGEWTTEVLQLGPMAPSRGLTFYHMTHKVVTLGGGVMGWVDLCRGILLCDVLVDHPQPHYIPLPKPDKQELLSETSAREFRDIAVVQDGHIRCVEHQTHVRPLSHSDGTYISDDWTVITWSWKITNPSSAWEGRWEKDCEVVASRISGSLPKLLGQAASLPPLQQLHTGRPTLSLDEDDVVYVVAKVDHRDDKAFMLAVNMRDGALQAAEYFRAERMVGISCTYTQYRPSDYPEITRGKVRKHKRRPGLLPASSRTKKPDLRPFVV